LIYRGDRIVNWDPKMQSNVSDIEVNRKEEKAPFYYFQYGPFVIGTSRPETKFGDKYVVMHPDDKRYAEYKDGDAFECEWINGKIVATIIKDEAVDMAFGTGVMTITPWHDATDFFIAERHKLDKEQVIDFNGNLLSIAGEFAGMHILDARPKIVEKLKEKGLLVKVDEEYMHSIATNSRGGGLIEPQIMKQWWVDVNKTFKIKNSKIDGIENKQEVTLKKVLQHVVRNKNIDILPERFEKSYFNWVDNLLDWCLSRQLWYGHRVPAWYRGDEVYVGVDAPEGDGWEQDSDTLDTWFSAGMFSFTPLGGIDEETDDLKTYHPTSVLETGYDILTFWVVRMILMTTYLREEIPFKTVYLHGLVRDDQGRKMSKSLDNIIDPLDVSQKFGTDAVRLSLVIGSSPGNDSKLSEEKIGSFRNFANKLWNMSRFMLLNINESNINIEKPEVKTLADEWILWCLKDVLCRVTTDLEKFNFSSAGENLRAFTWDDLADWYLEIAKIEGDKSEILNYILNTILKLWHPFMPFVTEQIWTEIYGEHEMLMISRWPIDVSNEDVKKLKDRPFFGASSDVTDPASFGIIQNVITNIRFLRSDYKIDPAKKLNVIISAGDKKDILRENVEVIKKLARLENITIETKIEKPVQSVAFVESGVEVFINLEGVVDFAKEKDRLQKEMKQLSGYVTGLDKKLGNKQFVDNAPTEVVKQEKEKLEEGKSKLKKLAHQLENFS